jgi:hypothetical protein
VSEADEDVYEEMWNPETVSRLVVAAEGAQRSVRTLEVLVLGTLLAAVVILVLLVGAGLAYWLTR